MLAQNQPGSGATNEERKNKKATKGKIIKLYLHIHLISSVALK